jgi:hypothetical protein
MRAAITESRTRSPGDRHGHVNLKLSALGSALGIDGGSLSVFNPRTGEETKIGDLPADRDAAIPLPDGEATADWAVAMRHLDTHARGGASFYYSSCSSGDGLNSELGLHAVSHPTSMHHDEPPSAEPKRWNISPVTRAPGRRDGAGVSQQAGLSRRASPCSLPCVN